MTTDKRSFFSKIFFAMMLFCALVWVWTAAIIISWPTEKKAPVWKPHFRLAVTCANKEVCGMAYQDLATAQADGRVIALTPPEPAGDLEEPMNWLRWKLDDGTIEVKSSSWHFQDTISYRIEEGKPVILQSQEVGTKAFYYGVGAALFTLIGLYLRKLRN